MANTGRYLYGLVRSTTDLDLGDTGVPIGGVPARVRTIRLDDIAAVVSDFPAKEKILPLRRNLEPHNRVIREVMQRQTIVPMAFGQVARSEAEITKALRRNHGAIRAELLRLDGKAEMTLRVRWDVENIFDYLVREDRELARARDELYGRSRPPTQSEKIELGRLFEERLAHVRETDGQRLAALFAACVAETKVGEPRDEKAVAQLAFLVRREAMKEFEETVYSAAASFSDAYVFDYNGPWAPFSFVDVDLRIEPSGA